MIIISILVYLMMYITPKGNNKLRRKKAHLQNYTQFMLLNLCVCMYVIYGHKLGYFFLLAKYELFKDQWLSSNRKIKDIPLQILSMSVSSPLLFIVFLTTSFSKEIIALDSFLQDPRLLLSINFREG